MRPFGHLIIFFFVGMLTASAQFIPATNIPVTQYGDVLESPLTGGFSAPQFSNIDINFDGLNDLYVFDRGAWASFVFVRDADDNTLRYAPEYTDRFPELEDWALLRDYNADNIPDIFTYSLGSTAVYKGILDGGELYFTLEKNELIYTDGAATVALYTSRTDIPSVDDIDGDGDLDILSFSVSNATIRYYKNISVESGYGADSLVFSLDEYCWGELFEEASCEGAVLYVVCKGGDEQPQAFSKEQLHIGSTIVTFDRDGDGDKDAIIGDNTCNNLVYYRNGGSAEYAQMVYRDSEFPSSTVSFYLSNFPAAYVVDADNDGDQDIVATVNDQLLGANLQQVWWYENLNTNDTFDLVFASDTFLVSEMIDAGMYSKPVFFDHNADGLLDILIGVGSSFGKDAVQRHGLWLYENTGTATSPAFDLVTTDYTGLNAYPIAQLSPAPGDPDNDGDTDLVIGLSDGTLCFLENTAGAGNTAAFAAPVFVWQGMDVGQLASPCFFDIQNDGLPDLVVGEQNGNLNYFHNTGTAADPVYTLESEVWGGVDVRETGFITGYSAPFLFRNENDSLYLLTGAQSGKVHGYNEIEDALLGEFFEFTENYLGWYPGTYASVWGADINGDGEREWLAGNIRGGVQLFVRDDLISVNDLPGRMPVTVYPNPAADQLQLVWNAADGERSTIQVYNAAGASLYAADVSGGTLRIDIPAAWPAGMYLIRITTEQGSGTAQVIIQR